MLLKTITRKGTLLLQGLYHHTRHQRLVPGVTLVATASIFSWFVVTNLQPRIQDQPPNSPVHTSPEKSTQHSDRLNHSCFSSTMPHTNNKMREDALYGMFIGDSLSMPVHWYYDTDNIKRDFNGWLTGFEAPRKRHPTSILTISAVGGAGRSTFSGKQKSVIGDIILHGKLQYWTKNDRSVHYHQGMAAGDNTLNNHCALRAAIQASKDPDASYDAVLSSIMTDYVHFMTTPNTHNDTYAESYHREFFKSWDKNGSPTQPEEVMSYVEKRVKDLENKHLDHNIDGIGALVHPIPLIIQYADKPVDEAAKQAVKLTRMTHASVNLDPFVDVYARTLHGILNGESLREKINEALTSPPIGNVRLPKLFEEYSKKARKYEKGSEKRLEIYQSAVSQMGLACYIKGSMVSMFFLAYEFHDDFEGGMLANTNCGGENCNRGSALGALLGAEAARIGKTIPERFKSGLNILKPGIQSVVDKW
ncbi:uncharacterized protein LOC585441 isoform X1 [Strongylocentrotus purpuratus]|uniref:ADP-ribosylglycohydrolase n=1 Tax=Strongylocentrotus purpuratus TaxID=7668 RepID=A0A7M7HN94_STRPU|nr:uncharacterized protein LOC585441 isoform X1 [Strongylocentrotus purpuratus]